MPTFTDQLQRRIVLPDFPPRRIVSLVPSQTELLADLGLEAEVVGVTKFCIRPENWFREKPHVGGTKTLNFKKIAALQPDLLIGNKEENERSQIELLENQYPVWMSDVTTLADGLDMIEKIGALTNRSAQTNVLIADIRTAFSQLEPAPHPTPAAYLIWRKPYMAAGDDTFINSMLRAAGFQNVLSGRGRYPEIAADALVASQPEVVFLSSEPYPFRAKHLAEIQEICPNSKILLVDGEMFSWYGSRLRLAPAYFQQLKKQLKNSPS